MPSKQQWAALLALTCVSACAPSAFRAHAGAAFVRVNGDMGLQNSGGGLTLNQNMNDLRDDLQSGETEATPYLRVEMDWGKQRFKVSGFGHSSAGSGTLGGDFGDIPSGSTVQSDTDFFNVTGSWSYDLMPSSLLRLAPGVQLGYYGLDVSTRSQALTAFEEVETDLIVPMPYLEAEVDLGYVAVQANVGIMSLDAGDADGRYWDAEALAILRPADGFELIGGFRYLLIDAHGTASSRDFDTDLDIFGFFLGGGISF